MNPMNPVPKTENEENRNSNKHTYPNVARNRKFVLIANLCIESFCRDCHV